LPARHTHALARVAAIGGASLICSTRRPRGAQLEAWRPFAACQRRWVRGRPAAGLTREQTPSSILQPHPRALALSAFLAGLTRGFHRSTSQHNLSRFCH
jgi:hypothetical protein